MEQASQTFKQQEVTYHLQIHRETSNLSRPLEDQN
jgi:hypothetical protein